MKKSLLILLLIFGILSAGCSKEQNLGTSTTTEASMLSNKTDETVIILNGESILVEGSGATANGNILTISKAGTYIISGTLNDGQILINSSKDDIVNLVLNGIDITNKSGAPIYALKCDKLILTIKDGTNNTITDGGLNFKYENEADKEPNAALFSKDDLSINGTGSLIVNAGFNDGIGAKDGLVIDNGKFTINSKNDGIQADTALTILNGNFNIKSGGGSSGKASSSSESYKGIKATGDISISGGEFIIDSLDDSIHSNGNVTISGGTIKLSTKDDAVHADKDLTVSGGKIDINTSYEGLEGYNVIISNGDININSSNDGINAAGEGDSKMGAVPRKNATSSSSCYIEISGGNITLVAGEDGLDANGTINISGGYTVSLVNLNGNTAGNAAVDPDGGVNITGGTLIYGGTISGQNPSGSSTQSYVYTNSKIKAGTEVTLKKDENIIVTFTPSIDCANLAISSKDIKANESYDLYSGTNLVETITAGVGGGMKGGRR